MPTPLLAGLLVASLLASNGLAATGSDVQARMDADIAGGRPIVVHVTVALCDNANQGIVRVSPELGNGQDPRTNLYWGALYGVRTHFRRTDGWAVAEVAVPDDPRVLDRVAFTASLTRGERTVPVHVIADAWDGAHIRDAIAAFLQMAAGGLTEEIVITDDDQPVIVAAGGDAHLVAYVGHDGLMEFALDAVAPVALDVPPRSAVVLACVSQSFFLDHLVQASAHPLLLTTGLMAPEAYTLESAVRAFVGDGTTAAVVEAAAQAYNHYQSCGIRGARGLFWGSP